MNTEWEKRKRFKRYCREHSEIASEWFARGCGHPYPEYPTFPDDLRELACGAKTRAGTPCKITTIYKSGRCKFHGGLSTGPKTAEGKARISAARRKTPCDVK